MPVTTRVTSISKSAKLGLAVSVAAFASGCPLGFGGNGIDSQGRLQRALFLEQSVESESLSRESADTAEAHYQFLLGELALADERQEEALKYFEQAAELESGTAATLRLRLASLYLQSKQLEKANKQLAIVSAAEPENIEALQLQAGVLATLKREKEAIKVYRKLIALRGQQSEEPYIFAASLHLQAGQLNEAKALLQELLTVHPNSFFANYYLARIAEAQSNLAEAEQYFFRSLELNPRADAVRVELARLYGVQKRYDDGLKSIDEVLRNDEHNVEAKTIKAQLLLGKNQIKDAIAEFEEVSSLEEDSSKTRFRIALIKLQQRNVQAAINDFNLVLAAHPENTAARYYLASAYAGQGQVSEALEQIREINSDEEYFEESRTLGAFMLQREERYQEGVALVEEVLEKKEEPKLLAFLANLQKDAGDSTKAISTMKRLIELEPDSDQHYFTLGVYYDQEEDRDAAIKAMKQSLKINPNNSNALNYLGYTYAEEGENLEEAERLVSKALELEPKNGYYLDSLGWIYYRQGRLPQALEKLEKAVAVVPNDAVILEHLAIVYQEVGRAVDAKKIAEKALEFAADSDDKGVIGRLKKLLQSIP
jgi:tetratricopeptide (TPR) repeat protein